MFISLAIAIPLGRLTAYRANRPTDRAVSTVSFGLLSLPPLHHRRAAACTCSRSSSSWLPAQSKYYSFFDNPSRPLPEHAAAGDHPRRRRDRRSSSGCCAADMIATLQSDFITMARAKGMPTTRILFRHALRPSMFSLITAAAVNVGALIGGAVIVEKIFGLPGMGELTVEAVFRRDFLVVQFCVVIFAVGLRARELRRRRAVRRDRPEDPPCPSPCLTARRGLPRLQQRRGRSTLLTDSPFGVYQEAADDVSAPRATSRPQAAARLRSGSGSPSSGWPCSPFWPIFADYLPFIQPYQKVNVTALKQPPSSRALVRHRHASAATSSAGTIYGARMSLAIAGTLDRDRAVRRRDPRVDRRLLP